MLFYMPWRLRGRRGRRKPEENHQPSKAEEPKTEASQQMRQSEAPFLDTEREKDEERTREEREREEEISGS